MSAHGILGIDHPVVAVRDMAAAQARYERLGFTIPPRGSHLEWGTGNWCIMFPHDYLELRGITDPAKYTHGLEAFLDRGEGMMGVALATDDAEASYRGLVASGLHPQRVRHLTRNFELPDGHVQPRFALCFLEENETPGLGSVVLCQHQTPELIRRPEWLLHANDACGLISLTSVVENLSDATRALRALFGNEAVRCEKEVTTILFKHSGREQSIRLTTREKLADLHAMRESSARSSLGLTVITLQVADPEKTAAWFTEHRIPNHQDKHGTICLSADEACGAVLEFTTAVPE